VTTPESFEESLQNVLATGVDASGSGEALAALLGDLTRSGSAPLSEEERGQLVQRERDRLADPAYRRRLEATDQLFSSLLNETEH
jgi:hypothetical protein